ncbi:MAG: SMC-Scp complex subunit ScpB [Candidatus Woesearchaeota archaeon]|nr:MAG: SMC-Scp complex subunit ScpB [Candidatus Woesearchaeota archaeon]
MDDHKKKIEAILFATGKSLSLEELARLCATNSTDLIKQALQELQKEYSQKDTSLELVGENDFYKLAVKKDYQGTIKDLLPKTELDKSLLETLSVIAWKQPMTQSEVVKVRGTLTYDHVKILKEAGYVESEKLGRTRKLKLTSKFYDYFDISREELKDKFKNVKDVSEDLEKTAKEKKIEPFSVAIPDRLLIQEK